MVKPVLTIFPFSLLFIFFLCVASNSVVVGFFRRPFSFSRPRVRLNQPQWFGEGSQKNNNGWHFDRAELASSALRSKARATLTWIPDLPTKKGQKEIQHNSYYLLFFLYLYMADNVAAFAMRGKIPVLFNDLFVSPSSLSTLLAVIIYSYVRPLLSCIVLWCFNAPSWSAEKGCRHDEGTWFPPAWHGSFLFDWGYDRDASWLHELYIQLHVVFPYPIPYISQGGFSSARKCWGLSCTRSFLTLKSPLRRIVLSPKVHFSPLCGMQFEGERKFFSLSRGKECNFTSKSCMVANQAAFKEVNKLWIKVFIFRNNITALPYAGR